MYVTAICRSSDISSYVVTSYAMVIGHGCLAIFFFQAEDGIRDLVRSRGLGDVYKRQGQASRAAHLLPAGRSKRIKHIALQGPQHQRRPCRALEDRSAICRRRQDRSSRWRSPAAHRHGHRSRLPRHALRRPAHRWVRRQWPNLSSVADPAGRSGSYRACSCFSYTYCAAAAASWGTATPGEPRSGRPPPDSTRYGPPLSGAAVRPGRPRAGGSPSGVGPSPCNLRAR